MRMVSTCDDKYFPQSLSEAYQVVPLYRGDAEKNTVLLCGKVLKEAETQLIQDRCSRFSSEKIEFIQDRRYNIHKVMEEYYDICFQKEDYRQQFLQAYHRMSMEELLMFCIQSAAGLNASDIHLISESESLRAKLRIDGMLRTLFSVQGNFGQQLIRYIKVRSQIDISRTMTPLEGRFTQNVGQDSLDIRVSIMPTVVGEKISLRILGIGRNIFDLDDIGFTQSEQQMLRRHIYSSSGFVLASGPTGAGKSTTLLALMHEINDGSKNIISIEDPVEYRLDGVTQVSLVRDSNSDFHDILKFTLRQDPDVILIGEIRDGKTADTGLKAAITGHLVLSSIHTKSSVGAIERLMDLGIPSYIVSDSISLIINQRLIRMLCPFCKKERRIDEQARRMFGEDCPTMLYCSGGCPRCYGTGYAGRKAVFELLEIREEERGLIKEHRTEELSKAVVSLEEKIKALVLEGKTSIDEYAKYL